MRQAPTLFVDPQDVILRMQLDGTLAGIEDVVISGLVAAQLHVERVIDGKLKRQKQDARYFIDSQAFSGIAPGGLYRLEIPSGMVRQDVPAIVTFSSDQSPFGAHSSIDSGLMKFDYNRGYLYVDAKTYGDNYVRAQVETGFEDGTSALPVAGLPPFDQQQTYAVGATVDYQGKAYTCIQAGPVGTLPTSTQFWKVALVAQEPIPDPIYEAIMSLVPMVLNAQQTTNRSEEAEKQYRTLTDHANVLLQPFIRTQGFTFRAI